MVGKARDLASWYGPGYPSGSRHHLQQNPVDLITPSCHHDDRHCGPLAEFSTHDPSIQIGEPEVKENEVHRLSCQSVSAIRRELDIEPLASESGTQRFADAGIVLDNQQAHVPNPVRRRDLPQLTWPNLYASLVKGCTSPAPTAEKRTQPCASRPHFGSVFFAEP